jgi:hypothetical protein
VTKRIYSNELKVTEHPDGDWVKREEYEQLKQRCVSLEDSLLEQYNYGTLERRDIEALIPNIRKEQEK